MHRYIILAHAIEPVEVDRQITILRSSTDCFPISPYI